MQTLLKSLDLRRHLDVRLKTITSTVDWDPTELRKCHQEDLDLKRVMHEVEMYKLLPNLVKKDHS